MNGRIDDDALIEKFRRWLADARVRGGEPDDDPADLAAPDEDHVGLYQLFEEFTALRHELKLQTRSARGLQEQTESVVESMRQAIEQFRAVGPKESQAAWSAGKNLAEALAELDVALDRGRAEAEKAARRLRDEPVRALETALDALYARQSWLRRKLFRSYHAEVRAVATAQAGSGAGLVDLVLEGFGLIQNRLRRALKAEQVEPIACIGLPVDPERMTVVDVIDAPGQPGGIVLEEVRRGYTWQGRLLRYAEVQASRGAAPAAAATEDVSEDGGDLDDWLSTTSDDGGDVDVVDEGDDAPGAGLPGGDAR